MLLFFFTTRWRSGESCRLTADLIPGLELFYAKFSCTLCISSLHVPLASYYSEKKNAREVNWQLETVCRCECEFQ